MENKTGPSLNRSYSDFEPYCRKSRDDEREILEIHLKDFKKENLKVELNYDHGILTIHGEHPSNGDKWSRFCKEIRVSKECDLQKIRAKLSEGVLTITMTKKSLAPLEKTQSGQYAKPQDHAELQQMKASNGITRQGRLWRLKLNGNDTFKCAGVMLVLLVTYGIYIAYRKICTKHV